MASQVCHRQRFSDVAVNGRGLRDAAGSSVSPRRKSTSLSNCSIVRGNKVNGPARRPEWRYSSLHYPDVSTCLTSLWFSLPLFLILRGQKQRPHQISLLQPNIRRYRHPRWGISQSRYKMCGRKLLGADNHPIYWNRVVSLSTFDSLDVYGWCHPVDISILQSDE